MEPGPHQRQRAQEPDEHLQVGIGHFARTIERASDPPFDVAPLRLAQREREHHAAGDARLHRRGGVAHAAALRFVEDRDPSVEQGEVVELVEDRIHRARGGKRHSGPVGRRQGAKPLEGLFIPHPRLARRDLRPAGRRPEFDPGMPLARLGRQVFHPVCERLPAALAEHRLRMGADQPRHLVPVPAFAVQRDRLFPLTRRFHGCGRGPQSRTAAILMQRFPHPREQELAEHRVILVHGLRLGAAQRDEMVVAVQSGQNLLRPLLAAHLARRAAVICGRKAVRMRKSWVRASRLSKISLAR